MTQERVQDDSTSGWSGLGQLDPVAMTAAGAIVGALSLMLATIMLLLQGPAPGRDVGMNLEVLGSYLPGYSVSWIGACFGVFYGAGSGAVMGFLVAVLWNLLHLLIIRWIMMRWLMSRI